TRFYNQQAEGTTSLLQIMGSLSRSLFTFDNPAAKVLVVSSPDCCCLQHHGERCGLRVIFSDDLNCYDKEMLLVFATVTNGEKRRMEVVRCMHQPKRVDLI
ncbi:hypothetical protein IFM89_021777, partial [Coptis chinensis]